MEQYPGNTEIGIVFFIPGPLPGRNEQEAAARTNRYAAASMKKKWTQHCAHVFAGTGAHFDRIKVCFTWIAKDRRMDPDNVSCGGKKFIMDGLVMAGIIKNDGWKNVSGFTDHFHVDKRNPGVIVNITSEEGET